MATIQALRAVKIFMKEAFNDCAFWLASIIDTAG